MQFAFCTKMYHDDTTRACRAPRRATARQRHFSAVTQPAVVVILKRPASSICAPAKRRAFTRLSRRKMYVMYAQKRAKICTRAPPRRHVRRCTVVQKRATIGAPAPSLEMYKKIKRCTEKMYKKIITMYVFSVLIKDIACTKRSKMKNCLW